MEKIHENMNVLCFRVNFKQESTKTRMFPYTLFHLVPTFTPNHIIMVKGLLSVVVWSLALFPARAGSTELSK